MCKIISVGTQFNFSTGVPDFAVICDGRTNLTKKEKKKARKITVSSLILLFFPFYTNFYQLALSKKHAVANWKHSILYPAIYTRRFS